jgi:hypothetical protein
MLLLRNPGEGGGRGRSLNRSLNRRVGLQDARRGVLVVGRGPGHVLEAVRASELGLRIGA